MNRRGARLLALLALLEVALVATAIWGADAASEPGVLALHAAGGRVYVGVGHTVWITDERGATQGALRDRGGRPYAFGLATSIDVDELGGILIADASHVVRFSAQGELDRVIELSHPPEAAFEVAAVRGGLVVADTMGHSLRTFDAGGKLLQSRHLQYPNGLSVLRRAGAPAILLALETGRRRLHVLDEALRPVSLPAAMALTARLGEGSPGQGPRASEGPWARSDLLDLAVGPRSEVYASLCRNVHGECTVARADGDGKAAGLVADLASLPEPGTAWARELFEVGELAITSQGELLIASPRHDVVLRFSGSGGGPPPAGFCERCSATELRTRPIDPSELARGVTWPNGTRIERFGDAALVGRYQAVVRAQRAYDLLETIGRTGAAVVVALLLLALFAFRQAGVRTGDDLRGRFDRVARELARPDRRNLATAVGLLIASATLGLAAGSAWGLEGAVAWAAIAVMATSRFVVTPLLVRRRGAAVAGAAAELFLPPAEGPRRAAFACSARGALGELAEAIASDPLEAAEALSPRLLLVVREKGRILVAPCSLLGVPTEPIEVRHVRDTIPSLEGHLVLRGKEDRRVLLAPALGEPEDLEVGPPEYVCERCQERVGHCAHTRPSFPAAALLTLVLPGAGHLLQGRFRLARGYALGALSFALAAASALLPQLLGTLPWNPQAFARPAALYAGTMLLALVELVRYARRMRRMALRC